MPQYIRDPFNSGPRSGEEGVEARDLAELFWQNDTPCSSPSCRACPPHRRQACDAIHQRCLRSCAPPETPRAEAPLRHCTCAAMYVTPLPNEAMCTTSLHSPSTLHSKHASFLLGRRPPEKATASVSSRFLQDEAELYAQRLVVN